MVSVVFTPNISYSFLGTPNKMFSAKIQLRPSLIGTWQKNKKQYDHQCYCKNLCTVIEDPGYNQNNSTAEAVEMGNKVDDLIAWIKTHLITIEDGRISVSAYDTAWIALIKNNINIDGHNNNMPQFPSSLEWIVQHQLADGSWGDEQFFSVYDRLLNTIACIVALKSWNVHSDKIEKGIWFVKKHASKLEEAYEEHMTCGFEVIYPTLVEKARHLGIHDIPISNKIYAARDHKINKIPRELMHEVTTTLLYSLEGLEDLDWPRLLKLQSNDGSFFTSPSSTAFAFMETKDPNCLKFITNIVHKFNGGAPHTYPVDLFARLWTVDRLQRLGISHFFEREISDYLTYVYKASQIRFRGEDILEEAYDFSYNFLRDWLRGDQLLDKWVVSKDLPNEIKFGLEVPWYATLPRVEAAYYLQHYGGSTNVWIAKTLYRMPDIDNDEYLKLARLDFMRCQSQHQIEWSYMQRWYEKGNFQEFGITRKDLLIAYFMVAATIFQPERAKERIVWAKAQLVCKMIRTFFEEPMCSMEEITTLLKELRNNTSHSAGKINSVETKHPTFSIVLKAIDDLSDGFDEQIRLQLTNTWYLWLMKFHKGEEEILWDDAMLLVSTLNICSAHFFQHNDILLYHDEYITLSILTNKICHHLSKIQNNKIGETRRCASKESIVEIQGDMHTLTEVVLKQPSILSINIKQTFLWVAKTFYYSAYFDSETIDLHIFKVLFEPIPIA